MSRKTYLMGFVKRAAAAGIDPGALAKFAQISEKDVEDAKERVAKFNDTITLPTKKEFAGVPGKDWNSGRYTTGMPLKTELFADKDIPKSRAEEIFPIFSGALRQNVAGYVDGRDKNPTLHFNKDLLNRDSAESTMVHEQAHDQNQDVDRRGVFRKLMDSRNGVPSPVGSGRSSVENEKLNKAYRFGPDDITNVNAQYVPQSTVMAEQATTNREYRYAIWKDLAKKLGRDPTYDEFKDHIKNMSLDDIYSRFAKFPNAYADNSQNNRFWAIKEHGDPDTFSFGDDMNDPGPHGDFLRGIRKRHEDTYNRWKGVNGPGALWFEDLNRKGEKYRKSLEENKEWLEDLRRAWLEVAKNNLNSGRLHGAAYA